MKILLYGINFAPELTGIGKYTGEMAAWLAARGHEVHVVTAPPYYPAWKLGAGYAWPPYRRERWQGVDVWRAPLWLPLKPGGLARVLHLMSFAVSSLPVMLWQVLWRPDVVMSVAPALVCAPTGWLVAKLCGGRAWLHIQDFEVDMAFQMGLLKGRWLQSFVLSAERWLLRQFDGVTTISYCMLDRLRQKGVMVGKVHFFPNWVDITHVHVLVGPSDYRKQLGFQAGLTVVLFSGTLSDKQGLMVIPDAARRMLHRQDVMFVVCGDGVMKPQLEAASTDLANILFLPLQPFERLGQLLGLADLHLLTQSPEAADLVLPSKLSGMLASARPVIACCEVGTEIGRIVSQCGLVVPPDDGVALVAAIERLINDNALRLKLGMQARRYVEEHFEKNAVLMRLLNHCFLDTEAQCIEGN